MFLFGIWHEKRRGDGKSPPEVRARSRKPLTRVLSLLLVAVMVCGMLPPMEAKAASLVDSGQCGDNLTWTLMEDLNTNNLTLIISGTGPMWDFEHKYVDHGEQGGYDGYFPPWDINYDTVYYINEIVIEEGVTYIGEGAFYGHMEWDGEGHGESFLYRLAGDIVLPSTLVSFGPYAFGGIDVNKVVVQNGELDISSDDFNYVYGFVRFPSITTQPSPVAVKFGNSATFSVAASNATSYQWYESSTNSNSGGAAISGATSATYTFAPAAGKNGKYYYCVVSNDTGSTTSNAAKLTVYSSHSITTQPAAQAVKSGANASFTVATSGGVGSTAITYQWYLNSTNSNSGGTAISGAISATYTRTTSTADNGKYLYCVTSNGQYTVTSSPAKLTVYSSPAFSQQPSNTAVKAGETASFSVTASAGVGTTGLTYQWYKNTSNSTSGATAISGANSASYSLTTANGDNNTYYYCVIGNGQYTVTSSIAKLTVYYPPVISTQPVSKIVRDAETASFYAGITGGNGSTGLTYQWYFNGTPVSGATSATYNRVVVPGDNGGKLYCVISNGQYSLTTNEVDLTVYYAPTVVTQPQSQSVMENDPVSFEFTVIGGFGTQGITYQWYYGADIPIAGQTSNVYSLTGAAPDNAKYIYCKAYNGVYTVESNKAYLTVWYPPTIDAQPTNQALRETETVTFTFDVSGGNGTHELRYQWYIDGTAVDGATNPSYTQVVGKEDDGKSLYCTVTNGKYSHTSDTVSLTVYYKEVITLQPNDVTVMDGETATFAVEAGGGHGTAPLTYQWYLDGVAIPGATSATYSRVANGASDNGTTLYCEVFNGQCTTTSDTVNLEVYFAPTIDVQPASQALKENNNVSFSVAVSGGHGTTGYTYQWFIADTNSSAGGTPIDGAVTDSYTRLAAAADNGKYIYCEVSNGKYTVATSSALLTVYFPPVVSVQPTDFSAKENEPVTMTYEVAGGNGTTGLVYQWYIDTDNDGMGGTLIPEGDTGLCIRNIDRADNGKYFYCTVSNGQYTLTSNVIQATVWYAPDIDAHPVDCTVKETESLAFSVVVSGGNGTQPYSYQWYIANDGESDGTAIDGATASTYNKEAVPEDNGKYFYCEISNGKYLVRTNSAQATVYYAPRYIEPITDETQYVGRTVEFSFLTDGGHGTAPVTFQWYKVGQGGSDTALNPDGTYSVTSDGFGSLLSFLTLREMNGDSFYCKIDNGQFTITTPVVSLTAVDREISITFKNWNGDVLSHKPDYYWGNPITPPDDPTRPQDDVYTYTFDCWDNGYDGIVHDDAVYTAQYTPAYREYEIVFQDYDGTPIFSKLDYHWGDEVTIPSLPAREDDGTYTYTCIGWDTTPSTTVQGSVTYTAVYEREYIPYMITFEDHDGTILSQKLDYHMGDTVSVPNNPVRQATVEITYTFDRWTPAVSTTVMGDATYRATYSESPTEHEIVFKDYDGCVISTQIVPYGSSVTVPAAPSREEDNTFTYEFDEWLPSVSVTCDGPATYVAQYNATYKEYCVVIKDWDGSLLLEKTDYHWGDEVLLPQEPSRESDDTTIYVFSGYTPEVVPVAGDAVYTAVYRETDRLYSVKFLDEDDSILLEKTDYIFGDSLVLPEAPTKQGDAIISYVFDGWTPAVSDTVTADAVYKATYRETPTLHTVIFKDFDGTVLSSTQYEYGETPVVPLLPTRASDAFYSYTCTGWNTTVEPVSSSAVYVAVYSMTPLPLTDETPNPDRAVIFVDTNGDVLEVVTPVVGEVIATPEIPEPPKPDGEANVEYEFAGWVPTVDPNGNTVCAPSWVVTVNGVSSLYVVIFQDYDGAEVAVEQYEKGDFIEMPAPIVRADDEAATYNFSGWVLTDSYDVAPFGLRSASAPHTVLVYTASYLTNLKEFTVVFQNYDGTVISSETYHYGETVIPPANPSQSGYQFTGWTPTVSTTCVGDATYVATYQRASSGVGGSSFGGNTSEVKPTITLPESIPGGSVTVPEDVKVGDTVSPIVKPEPGYVLDKVIVTDKDGKPVDVTINPDGSFSFVMPEGGVTIEVSFKTASTVEDCDGADCPVSQYTDIKHRAWYHDGVHYCLEQGLMNGLPDNKFGPNGKTTRAQVVTVLWRLAGSPDVASDKDFTDMAEAKWAKKAILWAAETGITGGYGDGRFGPNDAITREQLATFLYRFLGVMGYELPEPEEAVELADMAEVSGWAKKAVTAICGAGVIQGTPEKEISPQGKATRAQTAVMLYRFAMAVQ